MTVHVVSQLLRLQLQPQLQHVSASRCGDPKLAMSEERSFATPPAPGSQTYPQRLTVVADLGQTHNSSRTLQHIVASQPTVRPAALAHQDCHCRLTAAI